MHPSIWREVVTCHVVVASTDARRRVVGLGPPVDAARGMFITSDRFRPLDARRNSGARAETPRHAPPTSLPSDLQTLATMENRSPGPSSTSDVPQSHEVQRQRRRVASRPKLLG